MGVTILHLSDIHAGKGELRDEDEKEKVPGAQRARQLDRLALYLRDLPRRPDYVVVSGDVTNRGDVQGLRDFRAWLVTQIDDGVLPPAECIILTPGNHDVQRGADGTALPDKERFAAFFETFGKGFPHAHIPDSDPKFNSKKPKFPTRTSRLIGGVTTKQKAGELQIETSFPFLLDLKRDLFIFAFNSAYGCGISREDDPRIVGPLQAIAEWHKEKTTSDNVREVLTAYRKSLLIDAGLITDTQLKYFASIMRRLRRSLKGRFERLTKIAFLHHHVGHLWRQQLEVKSFETVVDAADLKQALLEHEFDVVLHGHKHTNHVGLDGSLIPVSDRGALNPICIVSAGTVGGYPRLNDRQTVKLISLPGDHGPRSRITIQEIPLLTTVNYEHAMRADAKIYEAPIARRPTRLHDLSSLKTALDADLQRRLAPELEGEDGIATAGGKIPSGLPTVISGRAKYECDATLQLESHIVFYEIIQAVHVLDFSHRARLRWLLGDVAALRERKKTDHRVVVLIGNHEDTHFFTGEDAKEVSESLEKLKRDFRPAIKSGLLEVRTYDFSQEDVEALLPTAP
jgi:predicted phosphodiesterase